VQWHFFLYSATTCIRFCLAQPLSFQLSLSCATFFHFHMFMLFISSKTPSSQRVLGLPIGLLYIGFHLSIFCTILSSAMRSTWPNQFYPLTPNDPYSGRTAPLTSKRCILYIYSTNIATKYFKHGIYSPFFPLQNAVCFLILTVSISKRSDGSQHSKLPLHASHVALPT